MGIYRLTNIPGKKETELFITGIVDGEDVGVICTFLIGATINLLHPNF